MSRSLRALLLLCLMIAASLACGLTTPAADGSVEIATEAVEEPTQEPSEEPVEAMPEEMTEEPEVTAFPDPGTYYHLQTLFLEPENQCLEGNEYLSENMLGGMAFMTECVDTSGQNWKFVPYGDDGYFLMQTLFLEEQNKCLEGADFSAETGEGSGAFMYDCEGASGQLWKLVPAEDGYYQLQNLNLESQNKCLEGNVLGEDSTLGGAAFMDTCTGASGQLWKLNPVP